MLKTAKILSKGFTMVELLVVVSIIAIMTGALIPSFASYTKNQALRQAQEQLVNDLFTVQNNALSGKKNFNATAITHWGLRFNNNTLSANQYEYVTTGTPNDCSGAVADRVLALSENMDITPNSAQCVFFSLANGHSYLTSDKTLRVQRVGESSCFVITVSEVGLITRVKDITTTCP